MNKLAVNIDREAGVFGDISVSWELKGEIDDNDLVQPSAGNLSYNLHCR